MLAIYRARLNTNNASVETNAPDWHRWDADHSVRALLQHLTSSAEAAGIWTIETGSFPEKSRGSGVKYRLACSALVHLCADERALLLGRRSCAGRPAALYLFGRLAGAAE